MTLIDILKDYAFNKMQDGGLLLLPMPTGSGKTYTVHQFISDVVESGKKDKIIFVTSLNKNINPDELKKHFKDPSKFDEKVLWIKALSDCAMDNFLSATQNVNTGFENLDEFKKLKRAIFSYNQTKAAYNKNAVNKDKDKYNDVLKDSLKDTADRIRETLEPNFRKKIKFILNEEFKANKKRSYSEKKAYVLEHYQWLLNLYPQILTNDKQVYLMSMDKFLLRNDTIIEKSEYIFKELTEKAIIFIDEFDSTKKIMLNRLIDNAIKTQIDYIEAYKQIHHNLIPENLPYDMTIPSKRQRESKYGEDGLKEYLVKTQEYCNHIYEKYEMQLRFKLEDNVETTKTFLFQDLHNIIISNQKNKGASLWFAKNSDKTQNIIRFGSKDDDNAKNFKVMLDAVRGFLKFFAGCIQTLAINYQEFKQENGYDDYSLDDSIKSYLDIFISDSNIKKYFTEEILLRRKNKEEQSKSFFDGSFYENGFSYYSVEDDDEHAFTSSIKMTDLSTTPEKILTDLCSNARVFGISATSNISTCIGNYVLDFLEKKVGKHFFTFTSDEFKVLKRHFEKSINHYERVQIIPEKISASDCQSNETWDEINELINRESETYAKQRLRKTASVFEKFIQNDDIKSMLCFINAFPNNEKFNETILEQAFNDFSTAYGKPLSYDNNVITLRTDDFDITKTKITDKLSSGEKILVLSTYQTIGAGQNLQYSIPKKFNPIQINDFEKRAEKDFDAVYLELPTNLFAQLDRDKTNTLVEYISQLEYIKEDGELSESKTHNYIEAAFKHFYYSDKNPCLGFKNFVGYKKFVRLRVIQAIGRICRTNCKNRNIYIYYDEELCGNIDTNISETDLFNPEFLSLLKSIEFIEPKMVSETQKITNQAIIKSNEALNRIMKYVEQSRRKWRKEYMQQWQDIRRFVLQHPTLSENEFAQIDYLYKPLYLKLPANNNQLWFQRTGDYNDIEISFTPKNYFEVVSEDSARLNTMLQIPFIKEMFETEGFATEFKENSYIICPPVFTNIYKGALGEYVGKEIFKKYLKIELEEISDCSLFELFDYKVSETNIYIDFKHWNEYSDFLPKQEEVWPHISDKLNQCNGDKVLIINILADYEYKPNNDGRIVTFPRLYDCENKQFDQKVMNQILEILQ